MFPVQYEDTFATIRLLNSFYVSDESQAWVNVSTAPDSVRLGRFDNELAKIYRTKL